MKKALAKASNRALTSLAKKFAFTASVFLFHRPEAPKDLMK